MRRELNGKVALVTGSTKGIGFAIAQQLAENGALVMINGRDEGALRLALAKLSDAGAVAHGLAGDVSQEAFAKRLVEETLGRFGRLDILVNNAGGSGIELQRTEDITLAAWNTMIANTLTCAFLMSREAISAMKNQGGGKIINISSIGAFQGSLGATHYAAAKSGLLGLTRSLALEFAAFNIQVNEVAPGLTDTVRTRRVYRPGDIARMAEQTPLRRVASPDDIGGAVLFFASSLSDFITGQVLVVDGGLTSPAMRRFFSGGLLL